MNSDQDHRVQSDIMSNHTPQPDWDPGTLEQYLDTTRPPTTGEDIYKFWSALFNVIKALNSIHDVQPTDPNDPPILQG